ncbi:MAG TPA: glycoside hydrolase family 5 protein [Bryobacteraceae bacterium]|nr:glycoside hydrolase family 5 protein [Bryobacteraceae bacterium]
MKLPALATQGNRIVNRDSREPVLLRGVNRSGLEYGAQIPQEDIRRIVAEWNSNIIRIPFIQDKALNSEEYRKSLDDVIEWAAGLGAYTLLDLQWLDTTQKIAPLPDFETPRLWRMLAERYRGQPHVLYDLYNEPHDCRAEDWQYWARLLTDTIREVHPDSLIFISGIDWGYNLRDVPFDGPNLVWSTHVYRWKPLPWAVAFGHLAPDVPVYAAEWGGGGDDLQWGRELADYFNSLQMGWTAWSWSDYPHLQMDGEVTPFGELVRAELATPRQIVINRD